MNSSVHRMQGPAPDGAGRSETRRSEAAAFLDLYFRETGARPGFAARWNAVRKDLRRTGSWTPTFDELEFGCRVAWRNAVACIGRRFWRGLRVRDCRDLTTPAQAMTAIEAHLDAAFNGGDIHPTASVFDPGIVFWGDQVLRYAGYRGPGGQVTGDPETVDLTCIARSHGWAGAGGDFDLLPVLIGLRGGPPDCFDLPPHLRHEVTIRHPDIPGLGTLGLRWVALPLMTNMVLSLGGVRQTVAFNGWYTVAEIGARNLAAGDRYARLDSAARAMEIDARRGGALWRDRALLELNVAVLDSFRAAGVRIIDHHAAADGFVKFTEDEARHGRPTYGDRAMLLPDLSPVASPLFPCRFRNVQLAPYLAHRPRPW